MPERRLKTRKELAAELAVGEPLIAALVRRRQIPVIKLGYKTLRFRTEDVERALARLTIKEVVNPQSSQESESPAYAWPAKIGVAVPTY